jgi:hypothetical protein
MAAGEDVERDAVLFHIHFSSVAVMIIPGLRFRPAAFNLSPPINHTIRKRSFELATGSWRDTAVFQRASKHATLSPCSS